MICDQGKNSHVKKCIYLQSNLKIYFSFLPESKSTIYINLLLYNIYINALSLPKSFMETGNIEELFVSDDNRLLLEETFLNRTYITWY